MSDGITLTITADPAQAEKGVQQFGNEAVQQLDKVAASAQKATAAAKSTAAAMQQLGAQGGLSQAAVGLAGVGQAAQQVGTRVAGMSYYFRSFADSVRFALAGGGARAGFYAIDEAVRGLAAGGFMAHGALLSVATELVEIVPIAATVAAGWIALDEILSRPLPMNEYLAKQNDQLSEQVGWLKMVQELQRSGALTEGQAARDSGFNTGSFNDLLARGLVVGSKEGPKLTETGKAFAELSSLMDELRQSGLDETGKKIDQVEEKFQKLKDVGIAAGTALVQSGKMTQQGYLDLLQSISDSRDAAVNKTVDTANFQTQQENQRKAEEAYAKGQEIFKQMVAQENADLERQLTLQAAEAGKSREELYQQEFKTRMDLLTRQLYSGEISEKEYTEAAQEAQTKRIEGINRDKAAAAELLRENEQLAQQQAKQNAEMVLRNPYASQGSKEQALKDLISQTQYLLDQNRTEIELADTEKQRNELVREQMRLEQQLSGYKVQQLEQEKQMNNARVAGVQQMFGNMGAAAKAFGSEGVAVYKGFAIAQATIDTAKAAIGAYSAVVGIPYVGPILAPIAAAAAVAAGAVQIAEIESASAREHGGEISSGRPYWVGESGPEMIMPASAGRVMTASESSRLMDMARSTRSGSSGSTASQSPIHVNLFSDMSAVTKHIRDNPDAKHVIVDIMRANAHQVQPS